MEKTFFIADTHFGHSNIILYENRPFRDTEEMNKTIIENWNKTVDKQDTIFILGDFSLYKEAKTKEIVNSLNGNKLLVLGNHDNPNIKYYLNLGFDHVYDYPIIYDKFYILSHEPLYINSNMPYTNIFGHVHSNKEYTDFSNQSFCVSVERINYTPISFSEIKKKMSIESISQD